MHIIFTKRLQMIFIVTLLISCQKDQKAASDQGEIILSEYSTVVSNEEFLIGVPSIIRFVDYKSFFVYDSSTRLVYQLDLQEKSKQTIGGEGQGPGEYLRVQNFFIENDRIYITDNSQQLIHKYDAGENTEFISSFNYRPSQAPSAPPPAPLPPLDLPYIDTGPIGSFNNQPHITSEGNVLIYNLQPEQALYRLYDWEGNHLESLGEKHSDNTLEVDYNQFRTEIENKQVPSFFESHTFIVNDLSNPDEYFLIHSAIPRIVKYNSSGNKVWDINISGISEIEQISDDYYETMEEILKIADTMTPLRKYFSGVSVENGDLFLATYTYPGAPLWIHHFDNNGIMQNRFKIESEVELYPVFDVDFSNRNILIPTEEGDVRAYSF
ncbi:MAG: 6-bladed beta-propeller [Balneolaceae bacterium]|nr:6-bladed beta-propeller [Balneolaceae bacterium]